MPKKTTHTVRSAKKKVVVNDAIQYVLPLGGNGWVVKNSKAAKYTVITDSKQEAISIARNIAKIRHIQLEVHGRDGRVEKRESYVA